MTSSATLRRLALAPLALALTAGALVAPTPAVAVEPDLTQPFAIETDGTAPLRIAASPDGTHLFVANQASNGITVIDTATSAQVGSIPLGTTGNGVVVGADGTVWASQRSAGTVAKIVSPLSGSPDISYHPVGPDANHRPTSLALSPSGDTLYATVGTSGPTASRVVALSTTTGAVVDESSSVPNASSTLAVAPDGSIWVSGDTPRVLSTDLDSPEPMPGLGSGRAGQVALTADGATAYVAAGDEVKVVDTTTMSVRDTIATPDSQHDPGTPLFGDMAWLALSPDEQRLYAVDYNHPAMAVIDIEGALAESPGAFTQIDGPTELPEDAGDWNEAAYLNSVVAVDNAFYVAVDGTAFDGTTIMRYPVVPRAAQPTTAVSPGGSLDLAGEALVGASVTIGGQTATTTSSSYTHASVKVPDLLSISSGDDVPVAVTTDSGVFTTEVDAVVMTGTPRISGTPRVDGTLTASSGTWTPGTSIAHQWLVDGVAVHGATRPTFTPRAADVGKRVTVRATGAYGSWARNERTSAATNAVVRAALVSAKPKVSGKPKVGKRLTAKPGRWTPGTKLSYQWYAGKRAIRNAVKPKLKLGAKRKGKRIKVKVTGTKPGYTTVTRTSRLTKRVR